MLEKKHFSKASFIIAGLVGLFAFIMVVMLSRNVKFVVKAQTEFDHDDQEPEYSLLEDPHLAVLSSRIRSRRAIKSNDNISPLAGDV